MGEFRENFFTGKGSRVRFEDLLRRKKMVRLDRGHYKKGLLVGAGGRSGCTYGYNNDRSGATHKQNTDALNRWLIYTDGHTLVEELDAACSQRAGSKEIFP